uniref:Uncharacterized protein n=1 Tax=viral metagenome TaxID=1070528 RepID=A0A6C0EK82_9ZZZZ
MFNNNGIDLHLLITTILVGIIITNILNIDNSIHILLLICGLYIIVLCYSNNKETFTNILDNLRGKTNNNKFISTPEDYNNSINNNLENQSIKTNTIKDNFSSIDSSYWPQKTKKNKSPFEGLLPQQLKNRLNYLYYATSHPFKAKSYTDYLHSNNCLSKSVKHINVAREYYPQLSHDQVNFNDCLNFPKGHPMSCNLGNDKWEAEEQQVQLLSDCISNEKDLKQVVIEDFDQKKLATDTTNVFLQ